MKAETNPVRRRNMTQGMEDMQMKIWVVKGREEWPKAKGGSLYQLHSCSQAARLCEGWSLWSIRVCNEQQQPQVNPFYSLPHDYWVSIAWNGQCCIPKSSIQWSFSAEKTFFHWHRKGALEERWIEFLLSNHQFSPMTCFISGSRETPQRCEKEEERKGNQRDDRQFLRSDYIPRD